MPRVAEGYKLRYGRNITVLFPGDDYLFIYELFPIRRRMFTMSLIDYGLATGLDS